MFYAYAIMNDGSGAEFHSEEAYHAAAHDCSRVWIDVKAPDEDRLKALGERLGLDAESVDDCLHGEQRPRIDEFESYAFLLVYGAIGPETQIDFSPRKLAIFLGNEFVITVHMEPMKTINDLKTRADQRVHRLLSNGTDQMLFALVDSLVDNYLLVADFYDDRLAALEEDSLEENPDPAILSEILDLRKDMLELRRLATSLREILHPMIAGDLDFISENIKTEFVHVRDHITLAMETIDNLRELLHGVRDNYHAALANRMNSIMQVLTIFASLFLPLSLVAGIYGMNTSLWPSPDAPHSFWYIIGAMAAIVFGMLLFFRKKRWL